MLVFSALPLPGEFSDSHTSKVEHYFSNTRYFYSKKIIVIIENFFVIPQIATLSTKHVVAIDYSLAFSSLYLLSSELTSTTDVPEHFKHLPLLLAANNYAFKSAKPYYLIKPNISLLHSETYKRHVVQLLNGYHYVERRNMRAHSLAYIYRSKVYYTLKESMSYKNGENFIISESEFNLFDNLGISELYFLVAIDSYSDNDRDSIAGEVSYHNLTCFVRSSASLVQYGYGVMYISRTPQKMFVNFWNSSMHYGAPSFMKLVFRKIVFELGGFSNDYSKKDMVKIIENAINIEYRFHGDVFYKYVKNSEKKEIINERGLCLYIIAKVMVEVVEKVVLKQELKLCVLISPAQYQELFHKLLNKGKSTTSTSKVSEILKKFLLSVIFDSNTKISYESHDEYKFLIIV